MAAARKKTTNASAGGPSTGGPTGPSTTCPWCSATVPAAAATCPSCGASLHEAAEGEVLGVTQVDLGAVSRAGRINPGRLATWLGAEKPADSSDLGGRIEPPSEEVRKEMLRLELAALDAELEVQKAQAEAQRDLLSGESPVGVTSAPTPEAATAINPAEDDRPDVTTNEDAPEAKSG